ncbi:MAG: hypothetical protein OXK16_14530 [bacterium]|nr:hypothetical protein [bacterium]MDE0290326.1 hypothetical protein [bacterium]MDE0377161.1 hypothetical protein [bacterium]
MTALPLDHNFPQPILAALSDWLGDVELLPIGHIDGRLTNLRDRERILTLYQLGYRGLVTNNYRMLQNPVELAAVIKTKLSVFAVEGLGDDPIRATGALLLDLPSVVNAVKAGRAGVFWLRPRVPQPRDPWDLFKRLANRREEEVGDLYRQVAVSDDELAAPVLSRAEQ